MCLVHLLLHAHPDAPLMLAGNRDEFLRRPSAPPARIAGDPAIHAGRDLEAGGSWMGANEAGILAAITNRYGGGAAPPPDALSRGEIVLGVLRHHHAEEAAQWVAALPVERYRPFNLLFGDAARFYFFSSGEGGAPRTLEPGFHALSNSTLNDTSWPKVARSNSFHSAHRHLPGEAYLTEWQRFFLDATPPDSLAPAGRDEEIHGAMGAVFIRTAEYGTVSSSIITRGGALGDRYYFAEGEAMRRAADEGRPPPYQLLDFQD